MQTTQFNIETETIITVSHYNQLWRVKPTIGQLKAAYEELLSDIDSLAADSDPDLSDEIIALSIEKPAFENLIIDNIQTADYDQTETGWLHIFLIRFSFTVNTTEYQIKFNNIFGK
jgi:hypothetical protein